MIQSITPPTVLGLPLVSLPNSAALPVMYSAPLLTALSLKACSSAQGSNQPSLLPP